MRGRTLDNAFIILDEAQNTTPEQMKMFLTRIGYGSKAIVTGDITPVSYTHLIINHTRKTFKFASFVIIPITVTNPSRSVGGKQ